MAIFKQNLTSSLIVSAINDLQLKPESKCLDLGCGDGNILRSVAQKKGLLKINGSDASAEAVTEARLIAEMESVNCDYRVGNLLEPWSGSKFDLVSCDIAAISATVANKSDWYSGVSCNTGEDGLALVTQVISQVNNFLNPGGIFIIPMLSLANTDRLYSKISEIFATVECVASKEWPMPKNLIAKIINDKLPLVCDNWNIEEKFGMFTAKTIIFKCTN
jgi:cyclopropane fatty-acyl-phospholipid synthase-like methyltransferase